MECRSTLIKEESLKDVGSSIRVTQLIFVVPVVTMKTEDIRVVANANNLISGQLGSGTLQILVARFLGADLLKGSCRISKQWLDKNLDADHVKYASLDAIASVLVYWKVQECIPSFMKVYSKQNELLAESDTTVLLLSSFTNDIVACGTAFPDTVVESFKLPKKNRIFVKVTHVYQNQALCKYPSL